MVLYEPSRPRKSILSEKDCIWLDKRLKELGYTPDEEKPEYTLLEGLKTLLRFLIRRI